MQNIGKVSGAIHEDLNPGMQGLFNIRALEKSICNIKKLKEKKHISALKKCRIKVLDKMFISYLD